MLHELIFRKVPLELVFLNYICLLLISTVRGILQVLIREVIIPRWIPTVSFVYFVYNVKGSNEMAFKLAVYTVSVNQDLTINFMFTTLYIFIFSLITLLTKLCFLL